jgi:hypothetical protein
MGHEKTGNESFSVYHDNSMQDLFENYISAARQLAYDYGILEKT